jgi:putative transposase
MQQDHGLSARRACAVLQLSRSAPYYRARVKDDGPVIDAVSDYMKANPRQGFYLLHTTFRDQKQPWGKTRLWRVYCALKLNLPRRGKKRLPERVREPLAVAVQRNETWSADFMADTL